MKIYMALGKMQSPSQGDVCYCFPIRDTDSHVPYPYSLEDGLVHGVDHSRHDLFEGGEVVSTQQHVA